MRRRDPRPFGGALERTARRSMPATALARLREVWPDAAGERVAREAEPVSERDGVVTIACRSAVWAQELELLSADLVRRLEGALATEAGAVRVRRLRFVTRSGVGGA